MSESPLISVVVPAYNAAATIERALRSVLDQSVRDLEVIVVDDASTDDTVAVVEAMAEPRVRLLRLEVNRGESGAMNAGIDEARGRYVAFQDADDEWLPGKLEKQLALIEADPELCFVSAGCRHLYPGRSIDDIAGFAPSTDLWKDLLAETLIAKPCVLARRSALDVVGPFEERLRIGADQDMWIRLALRGKVAEIQEILVLIHRTEGSLTEVHARRTATVMLPMIIRHLAAQADRLTLTERRRILAARFTSVGRQHYVLGMYGPGLKYLLRAIVLGDRPLENLFYLVSASPPARALKRLVSGGRWG